MTPHEEELVQTKTYTQSQPIYCQLLSSSGKWKLTTKISVLKHTLLATIARMLSSTDKVTSEKKYKNGQLHADF